MLFRSQKFEANPFGFALSFFAIYVVMTAASFPGAALLTLLAGVIFGFWKGVLIASFASTIGATLAFLGSRYLLQNWVQSKFGSRIAPINEGVAKDGAFYFVKGSANRERLR